MLVFCASGAFFPRRDDIIPRAPHLCRFRMNSDQTPPDASSANPAPASARPSNLKSRWKRATRPGLPPQRPTAAAAACGEVTNLTAARESLSGTNIHGYTPPEAKPPSPPSAPPPEAQARPLPPAPAEPTEPPARRAPPPERPYEPAPSPDFSAPSETAPTAPPSRRESPRREFQPQPRRESPREERREPPSEPRREAPREERRESAREERRDAPRDERRESPREDRREPSREPRRENPRGGEQGRYVALKPDPANEPAPRRLRTESSPPPAVQDYSPSAAPRRPDKSISHRHSHDRSDSRSGEAARVKPNASIPAHLSKREEEMPAAKGGIFGFIKRALGLSRSPAKKDSRESSREHHNEDGDGDEDHHHHHHEGQGDRGRRRRGRRGGSNRRGSDGRGSRPEGS
jgi:hypothetical protein